MRQRGPVHEARLDDLAAVGPGQGFLRGMKLEDVNAILPKIPSAGHLDRRQEMLRVHVQAEFLAQLARRRHARRLPALHASARQRPVIPVGKTNDEQPVRQRPNGDERAHMPGAAQAPPLSRQLVACAVQGAVHEVGEGAAQLG